MTLCVTVVCPVSCVSQLPNITEVQPDYGPVNGDTLINITGSFLHAGKNRTVTLDGEECHIVGFVFEC